MDEDATVLQLILSLNEIYETKYICIMLIVTSNYFLMFVLEMLCFLKSNILI